jgi:antitoxin (DNA-binding transcriptional repressor) of toxin-antitoxin stability system
MTVTLDEVPTKLLELLRNPPPGEELQLTGVVVATVVPVVPPTPKPPIQLGTLRGTVLSMEHFDDPLPGFEGYM